MRGYPGWTYRPWKGVLAGVVVGLVSAVSPVHGWFTDVAAEVGLEYVQMEGLVAELSVHLQSGGATAADFDGDGWTDLFVTRMGAHDLLFRNVAGPHEAQPRVFEDVSERAGFTTATKSNGAASGDFDNDGDLDLYVSTIYDERFFLYLNNGDGTFREEANFRGAALRSVTPHHGFSIAVGDYDRDGWLDLHTSEWLVEFASPTLVQHTALLRNLGAAAPAFFSNVTVGAGVAVKGFDLGSGSNRRYQFAFASRFSDLDNDGWPDLLVAADYGSSQLFWNNGDGSFSEAGPEAGVGKANNAMGSTVGDFNGDGLLDWFVTSIEDNRLYRNLGGREFEEMALLAGPEPPPGQPRDAGLMQAGWGWGATFFDFDNDGDEDLIMTNGHEDVERRIATIESIDPSVLWENVEGVFHRRSLEYGINDEEPGKGLLAFDYDRDGDQDIFIANCQRSPILYQNNCDNANAWIQLELKGRASNANGIGARIKVVAGSGRTPIHRELSGGSNYLGQNEPILHVGLGPLEGSVEEIEVSWPSGTVQRLREVTPRRRVLVREPVSYDTWRERRTPRNVPPLGGRAVDFDRDGCPNFEEYLFDTDPRSAKEKPVGRLLNPAMRQLGDGTYQLSYDLPVGILGVKVVHECSFDLVAWEDLEDRIVGFEEAGNTGELARQVVTFAADGPGPIFGRVRIVPE